MMMADPDDDEDYAKESPSAKREEGKDPWDEIEEKVRKSQWFALDVVRYLKENYNITRKPAMNEETKTTATSQLKEMASKVEITEKMKEYAIHEAAKDAFKILFVHFHGLGLKSHIDITFEQDGVKYQLLFKPLEAEIEHLKEGK